MSRIGEMTIYNLEKIQKLKEVCSKATQVVGWYPHPYEKGNIRGPWNRWIDVSPDREDTKEHVALHKDDVLFISDAMTHFPHVLDELEKCQTVLERIAKQDQQRGYPTGSEWREIVELVKNSLK